MIILGQGLAFLRGSLIPEREPTTFLQADASMVIAVLTVEYHLHGNDSLKGKRRVANSLKQKVRNTFNVAVAEYGTEDSLTRLRLMVISLSNSQQHLQSRMDKCLAMMEAVCSEEMVYSDLEFINGD